MTNYQVKLKSTFVHLNKFQVQLLESIINLSMTGDNKDINDIFQPGDIYNFQIDHFRNSKDVNINELVNLYDELENHIDTIVNLNPSMDEID